MANHKSAIKRIRQIARRTERKRATTSRLRTKIKEFRAAVTANSEAEVSALLPSAISLVDRSVQKGVLHRNKGNRIKSSLTIAANKVIAPP